MIGYYYGAKAAQAAWQEKAVRWLTIGLLGFVVYEVAKVTSHVVDAGVKIIDLPKEFLDALLHGWNQQAVDADTLEKHFTVIADTIRINPEKLQYNASAYITIANTLATAMSGIGTSSSFDKALEDVNNDDFKAVWLAFGLKRSTFGYGNTYQNLTEWMQGEREIDYDKYKRIFRDSGLL